MNKDGRQYKIFSGSALKLIAMTSMLIDHFAFSFKGEIDFLSLSLFSIRGYEFTIYYIMRAIGRLAFPLYCFLLVEGFLHTSDKKRYGCNLFVFALLSEIPWNLIHSGGIFYSSQNVFFTLLFGFFALYATERVLGGNRRYFFALLAVVALSYVFRADYGYRGVLVIIAMYLLHSHSALRAISCIVIFRLKVAVALAFIPIGLYNGQRGFIKGKWAKYAFYAFYPLHLLLFAILKICLFRA